jgi:predicted NACHT family NTPase
LSETLKTLIVNEQLNVRTRLEALQEWQKIWLHEETILLERVKHLNTKNYQDIQTGFQIASLRTRLQLQLVKEPIALSPEAIAQIGYAALRKHLVEQFVTLKNAERLLWLQNYLFLMTPDLWALDAKIAKVRGWRSIGQRRNFLLGGASGMGKTTYLNSLAGQFLPIVEQERNFVPIIKIDAPVSNRTPKPLYERLILECGTQYLRTDREEHLLQKLILCLQQCGVELIIIDEVQHIVSNDLRRHVLEISNLVPGIPIICASNHPLRWAEGDAEVQGRWNDFFGLELYKGHRLHELLAFIELLLPFSESAGLLTGIGSKGRKAIGPAPLIEKWTKGVLRDIMILIIDASAQAIQQNLPCLSVDLLTETWKGIQTEPPAFLAMLQQHDIVPSPGRQQ